MELTQYNWSMLLVHMELFGREVTIIDFYAPYNGVPDTMKVFSLNQISDLIRKIAKRGEVFILGSLLTMIKRKIMIGNGTNVEVRARMSVNYKEN